MSNKLAPELSDLFHHELDLHLAESRKQVGREPAKQLVDSFYSFPFVYHGVVATLRDQ